MDFSEIIIVFFLSFILTAILTAIGYFSFVLGWGMEVKNWGFFFLFFVIYWGYIFINTVIQRACQ